MGDVHAPGEVLPAANDVPAAGSPVTIVPVGVDGMWVGEVASWTASPGGLVVTSEVVTSEDAVEVLDGQRVWVLARTRVSDSLVVFEALARMRQATIVTLTGVIAIAHEPRRRAVRAATVRPVLVEVASGGETMRAHTVDLSRNGCRIALPPGQTLDAHSKVDLHVDLGADARVTASGEVLRVDDERRQAVLRFSELAPEDGSRIERLVLGQLRTRMAGGDAGD